jgi:hypothetical protein
LIFNYLTFVGFVCGADPTPNEDGNPAGRARGRYPIAIRGGADPNGERRNPKGFP